MKIHSSLPSSSPSLFFVKQEFAVRVLHLSVNVLFHLNLFPHRSWQGVSSISRPLFFPQRYGCRLESSTERVTVLLIIKHYTSELLFALRLLICFYTSFLTRCPKSFKDFTGNLFSSIVIDRHIILSLFFFFFRHESVSYITDLMDNFDSDTGRHELFFLTCNRCFSHLPTSSRPTFLLVLLLILRHL